MKKQIRCVLLAALFAISGSRMAFSQFTSGDTLLDMCEAIPRDPSKGLSCIYYVERVSWMRLETPANFVSPSIR
jgi:hypothetical protein